MAQETGFLKGNYVDGKNIPVKIFWDVNGNGVYNNGVDVYFVGLTNAQGKFTIPVKLQDEDDELDIVVELPDIEENKFKHYADATKTKDLTGDYEGEQIKENNAEWNDAGTIYYKFYPDAAPAEWNTYTRYIAGWTYKQGYNTTKTVKGQVKIAQETGFLKGDYNKSANNVPVKVLWDIDGDGAIDLGEPIFVAPTDAQGKFEIAIKVKDDEDKQNVVLLNLAGHEYKQFVHYNGKGTETLTGNYNGEQIKVDNEWNDGATVYDAGTIYYKFTPTTPASVKNWQEYTRYTAGWFYEKGYDIAKTVTGNVKLAKEITYLAGSYQAGANVPVRITLTGGRTYSGPTDANGDFSITVLTTEDTPEPNVAVAGLGVGDPDDPNDAFGFWYDEFTHVNKGGKTTTLSGKYFGTQILGDDDRWNGASTSYSAGTIIYKFYPKTAGKPAEWDTYTKFIAGWFYKAGYDIEKTIGGNIKIARETAFLTGDFEADATGTPIKIQVNGEADRIYVLPASANGVFELNIHVQDQYDEPDIAYVLTAIPEANFVDYINVDNKTQKIAGNFNGTVVREDGSAWKQLGTVYYKFTPTTPSTRWTNYTQYLAGWFFKKGYKIERTVSGKVKLAQESGFWKGDFKADAKGVPVKILIDWDKNGAYTAGEPYYVAATTSGGSVSVPIKVKDIDDNPDVIWTASAITLAELNDRKFTHWYVPGSDSRKNVAGNYVHGGTIKTDDEAADWKKLGTRYYTFNNTDGAENWTDDLCGWDIWQADQNKTLTIDGLIKKAIEEWKVDEAVPKWVPVPYALATVTVRVVSAKYGTQNLTYDVAATSSGTFTVTINQDEIPDDIKLTVVPANIAGVTDFKHWTDWTKDNTKVNAPGAYSSANNINLTQFDKVVESSSETNGYYNATTKSAKMNYTPSPAVPNWAHYIWNTAQEEYM